MGPTCCIAFENEPAEPGQMRQPPRRATDTFLAGRELGRSIAQGLGITAGLLLITLFVPGTRQCSGSHRCRCRP